MKLALPLKLAWPGKPEPPGNAEPPSRLAFSLKLARHEILLFTGAFAIRLANVLFLGDTPVFRYLFIDSAFYDEVGRRLASGNGFPDGVFFMNVLYGAFLGGVYALFGGGDAGEGARLIVLILQCTLGSAAVVMLARLGSAIGRPREGLAAAVALVIYGPAIFYDGALLTPSLVLFLLTGALLLASGPRPPALPLGILGGLLVLARANNVLLLPALAFPFVFPLAGRSVALFALGVALVVAPVTVRNYVVSGEVVPVTANGGMALWAGNHPGATGIYSQPGFLENPVPEREAEDYRREASRRAGRDLTLAQSSRFWFGETMRRWGEEPGAMLRLALRKARLFFAATESQTNLSYYFARDHSPVLQVFRVHLGWVLPLAILGLGITFVSSRGAGRGPRLLAWPVAVSFVTCVLFYVSSEYRHPVVPVLLLFGAIGAGNAIRLVRGGGRPLERVGVVVLLVVLFVAVSFRDPFLARLESRRVDYLNFGTLALIDGDLGEAERLLRESVLIDPRWAVSRRKLAEVLARQGRTVEAGEETARADALEGVAPPALERRLEADRLFREGRFEDAQRLFLELAGSNDAERALALNNAGLCAMRLARPAEAESLFLAAARQSPDYASPHIHLGRLALALGDSAAARAHTEAALGIAPDDGRALRLEARLE